MYRGNFFRAYGFWHWGEGFQTVLFTWYMTFHAQLSATEIGFYQALVLSPFLVFTLIGGALTDRIGAGLSYGISTLLFAGILIGYGILDHAFGFVPQLFFAYCVAAGLVSAVSNPAIDTFIAEATPAPVQRNALLAASAHNVAKLVGTLTGLLIPFLMAVGGFVVNGLLMALSVLFLRLHQRQAPRFVRPVATIRGGLGDVIAHFRAMPESFDIWLASVMLGLFMVPTGYILWPLVLRERFPDYGDMIALVNISSWIGAITVTVVAERLSDRIRFPGRWALGIWAFYSLGVLALMVVGSFWLLCATVMVFGSVKLGKALVYGRYLANSPEGRRGVLIALDQTAFWGLATLGTFVMGVMVDVVGLYATISGVAACVMGFVLVLTVRGNLTRITGQ